MRLKLKFFHTGQAAASIESGKRILFRFDQAAFTFKFLPFKVPYPVPFKLLGDEAKGWLDTTYLSPTGSIRISRGNKVLNAVDSANTLNLKPWTLSMNLFGFHTWLLVTAQKHCAMTAFCRIELPHLQGMKLSLFCFCSAGNNICATENCGATTMSASSNSSE